MQLSDLQTGEQGVIIRVLGKGDFRKRLVEMGFIKGKTVKVLLNAPLKDPLKYSIIGYEISLRREEAKLVEIEKISEPSEVNPEKESSINEFNEFDQTSDNKSFYANNSINKDKKTIKVALVGNPNCGKTSLFNFVSGAHERVGNYSGVTVEAKEGKVYFGDYVFSFVDLPGTYSLTAYSPEELYVRNHIIDKQPDVIINVIDAGNIERNLYLTTQLIDMNIPVVCALNMFDEFEKRNDHLDFKLLSDLLGLTMVPTVFREGRGINHLYEAVVNIYQNHSQSETISQTNEERNNAILPQKKDINHGSHIEDAIQELTDFIEKMGGLHPYNHRYLAIKLLENDKEIEKLISKKEICAECLTLRNKLAEHIFKDIQTDSETAIMDAKYGFINGALKEAGYQRGQKIDIYHMTDLIDRIITHKYWGFPIFFVLIFIMFQATFSLGQIPMDWIEMAVSKISEICEQNMTDGPVKDLIIDGIIGGVGAVIVFLPQILILYFFISLMEDSGYMARAAFIMDKLMHKMGLHGKSFIPLIMGFGCNVPAIMATRTIESRKSRLITMLILPFMSCSARIPIYIMITGFFFPFKYRSLVMFSLYILGMAIAVIVSKILNAFVIKSHDTPFVMELPVYRMPTKKAIFIHTWEKGRQYLKKMGGIILVASIIVWALGYFPYHAELTTQERQEQSYIGQIGKTIQPVFEPQGLNWKLSVSLISGVAAKEIVASTLGVLYTSNVENAKNIEEDQRSEIMKKNMQNDGVNSLTAYAYLIFILLYFPCIATIVAIKAESGSWKWAIFSICSTTIIAWSVSAMFYQIVIRIF